jgi:hypothetical protein
VAFAGMIGTLVAGLFFTLALMLRAPGGLNAATTDAHPLLFANPFYALFVVLNDPNGMPEPVGRLVQLLFFVGGQPATIGPSIEPWQGAVLVQLVLVALSVAGAIHLVQSRRAPMPWRPPAQPEPASPAEPAATEVSA